MWEHIWVREGVACNAGYGWVWGVMMLELLVCFWVLVSLRCCILVTLNDIFKPGLWLWLMWVAQGVVWSADLGVCCYHCLVGKVVVFSDFNDLFSDSNFSLCSCKFFLNSTLFLSNVFSNCFSMSLSTVEDFNTVMHYVLVLYHYYGLCGHHVHLFVVVQVHLLCVLWFLWNDSLRWCE